jgi:hypothetical protein
MTAAVVCLVLTGCSSSCTRTTLPENSRQKVFNAARTVLMKRFHGFRELDEENGILVTDYKMPVGPAPTARFYASVEVTGTGAGAGLKVRVVQEGLAFQDLRMVWVDTGRSEGVRNVEGFIIEEIRAHLEGRAPEIPRDPDAVAREGKERDARSTAASPAAPDRQE